VSLDFPRLRELGRHEAEEIFAEDKLNRCELIEEFLIEEELDKSERFG
jgi:hypothetical protein